MNSLSIITINYNNAVGLENTTQSIIAQKDTNFEYIIIDGASNASSIDVIKKAQKSATFPFKWISERDTGVYNAMNKGINLAISDYVLFINSGDYLYSETVISDFIKSNPNKDLVVGKLLIKSKISDERGQIKEIPDRLAASDLFFDYLPHPSTFIRRSLFDKIGLFNEKNIFVSDWEFFARAILIYNASYCKLNSIITVYLTDGLSCQPENAEKIDMEKRIIMQNFFPNYDNDYNEYKKLLQERANYQKVLELKAFNILRTLKVIYFLTLFLNLISKIKKIWK